MDEIELELKTELAIEVIDNKLVEITKEYSLTQDKEKSSELNERISVLNKLKDEVYKGNLNIINKVINKNRKGIL